MIFKHCLNITIILIIGATCGTTVAMKRKHEELKLEYHESPHTQLALNAGCSEDPYPKSGFQHYRTYFPELTLVVHNFKHPEPATFIDLSKNQAVNTGLPSYYLEDQNKYVLSEKIAKTSQNDFNFTTKNSGQKARSTSTKKHERYVQNQNRYEWKSDLITENKIPEEIQNKILKFYGKKAQSRICRRETRIDVLFQHLLTGRSITQLAAPLLNLETKKPLDKKYIQKNVSQIKTRSPKIMALLNDLVEKTKKNQN